MLNNLLLINPDESGEGDNKQEFEVIIIGGSYSGLSAALSLGRSLRSVLIIDSGSPCNRQTPHSHNFLTHDGDKPSEISEKAKEQILNYKTTTFLNDTALKGYKTSNGFCIITKSGKELYSKKLIFASGINDIMPEIRGFKECWGISIIHCPYCHGFEFRKEKTAILANGNKAYHLASLVNNLTNDITILTSGNSEFDQTQKEKLYKNNIKIVEAVVSEIEHNAGQIKNVVFKDGSKIDFAVMYASVKFIQNSDIPVSLGCELSETGHIKVDNFQKTTVEGVFACGDNSSMMRSVANAVATGNITGAMVNKELVDEEF